MKQDIKKDIIKRFDLISVKIFKHSKIKEIFQEFNTDWGFKSYKPFIEFLLKEEIITKVKFDFSYKPVTKYIYGDVNVLAIIQSLKEKAYFSHESALYLNKMIIEEPRDIYLNLEQFPKPHHKTKLLQENIDRAFKAKPRETGNYTIYNNYKVHLLNGKYTGNLGVEDRIFDNNLIYVTNIERTLIDVAVRPFYSGGIQNLMKIYGNAKGRFNIIKLIKLLNALDYLYPYHQAIGFYLEMSREYDSKDLEPLRKLKQKFNFYLTYGVQKSKLQYSSEWKVFYPESIIK